MPLQRLCTSSSTSDQLGKFSLALSLLCILNEIQDVIWVRRLYQLKLLLAGFLAAGIRGRGIFSDRIVMKKRGNGWEGSYDGRNGGIRVLGARAHGHHRSNGSRRMHVPGFWSR